MAARDDGSRSGRHDDEVNGLTTQISFLEEEIAVLRRRLADSPRHVRLLEERLREAEARLAAVTGQNERLAATLREARDQIVALKEEVDRLAQPPSGFGVFLGACDDGTADVFTGGRKMRVNVSPAVDSTSCSPARRSCSTRRSTSSSPRATRRSARSSCSRRSSRAATGRWSSRTPTRSGSCAWPSRCGSATLRAGDSLLLEPRSGYVYERIPKAEVEELILEEVPDIAYAEIGGLAAQIEQIRDAIELAVPARRPVPRAPAAPAQGRPAVRPARLRQDPHRQGGRQLAGQEGRRTAQAEQRAGGQELLPQHQGPRAAQQVRRRDRAAHPAGVPAGPGEGQRGHAGDRVLRRDGLDLPHPRLRGVRPTWRTPSCPSC